MEEQNVGTFDQGVRMVAGSLASISGIVLLVPGKASPVSGAVGIMLAIAGLYLFATGSTASCPIYRRLGWDTRHVRERNNGAPVARSSSHYGAGDGRRTWPMLLWCLFMVAAIAWIILEVWGARDEVHHGKTTGVGNSGMRKVPRSKRCVGGNEYG